MSMDLTTAQAVVLIDPVSSGRFLKEYVGPAGYKLVGVFTLTEDDLKKSGKYIPFEEKIKYCDALILSSDFDQILTQLNQLPYDIAAVIPASEPAVELADRIAERMCLPGNPVATSAARRDKFETRRAAMDAGLGGADFAACFSLEEAHRFARTQSMPIVVKTPKGAGAHHVFVCNTNDEVTQAFDQIVNEPNVFGGVTSFALAESFLSGPQYAVELFSDGEKIQLASLWQLQFRKNSRGKSIFEKMHTIINEQELHSLQHIIDYSIQVARAVGLKIGPCLVELRDDPARGPSLIEVGVRLSGIDMPILIRESSSFDPFDAVLNVYLKPKEFKLEPTRFHKHATLVFFPVDGYGTVQSISGMDEIEKLPSHVMNHLYAAPGEHIPFSSDLATIPLYVYLAHADQSQLDADITEVRRLFKIKFAETATAEQRKPELDSTL